MAQVLLGLYPKDGLHMASDLSANGEIPILTGLSMKLGSFTTRPS